MQVADARLQAVRLHCYCKSFVGDCYCNAIQLDNFSDPSVALLSAFVCQNTISIYFF